QATFQQKRIAEAKAREVAYQLEIEEVTVRAQREAYTTNRPLRPEVKFYNLDHMDWIPESSMGISLLSQLAPRFNFSRGMGNKIVYRGTDFQGRPVMYPIQILIDGMGQDRYGSDASRFLSLAADQIKEIYITPGGISVTTRKPPRSVERYLKSGVMTIRHPGYSEAREFYQAPVEDTDNDTFYSTLLWEPMLRLKKDGSTTLRLPALRAGDRYEVKLEGITTNGMVLHYQGPLSQLAKTSPETPETLSGQH
ncbi:MAG: hypothetical protein AAFO94_09365, partial [Bacteroidota bacterium]